MKKAGIEMKYLIGIAIAVVFLLVIFVFILAMQGNLNQGGEIIKNALSFQ